MPELPEVEVTRQRIWPALEGRTLSKIYTTKPSYFFLTPPRTLKAKLEGRTPVAFERLGKYLLLGLDDGSRVLLHLGMTGQLFTENATSPRLLRRTGKSTLPPELQAVFRPDEHTHLRLCFADGGPEVYFRDVRKFGKVLWLAEGASDKRLDKLGPDALSVTAKQIAESGKRRKIPIKTLLLDQGVTAGVGNIYADEALFLSGIRPQRGAHRVSYAGYEQIATNIQKVLRRSIETGGSSISDYINPDGADGRYQDERNVYAREGEPCRVCGTPIKRLTLGQRSSHFCPCCQT